MQDYPFVKCLHPLKIVNKHTKNPMIVGCGKCVACLGQKSALKSLKCKLESLSHKYTYFITLTYNNESIPKMVPVIDSSTCQLPIKTYNFCNITERFGVDSCGIGEVVNTCGYEMHKISDLYKKCGSDGYLPYLNPRDAQLFIKRLRKHISKYSDEKIRYYCAGEYGPVHYRPHFHFELWFSDEQIAENLSESICKSWRFGRVDVQKSKGQSASYVAGYLNSSCNLPRVFKIGKCKPFSSHSYFLGEEILKAEKEEVYKLPVERFIKRCINLDGTSAVFSVWRSFTSTYFPKCPKFSSFSHVERLASYRAFAETSKICCESTPFRQAVEIVYNLINDKDYAKNPVADYLKNLYNIHPFMGRTDIELKIRQVYIHLRVSKHFLTFVCNGDSFYEHDLKTHLIEDFYSKVELLNLKNFIKDRVKFETTYPDLDSDGFNFFFDNKFFDFDKFYEHKSYRLFREEAVKKSLDSVKHKYLNDKNKIFDLEY